MKTVQTFRLGIDDNVQPEHIGAVIAVDHYKRSSAKSPEVEMSTHFGKLTGFVEHRGSFRADEPEDLDDLDGSSFPDYHTTLIFEDGRNVPIRGWESATITIYKTAKED